MLALPVQEIRGSNITTGVRRRGVDIIQMTADRFEANVRIINSRVTDSHLAGRMGVVASLLHKVE